MLVHRGLSDLMPQTVHGHADNHEGAQMGLFAEYSGPPDDKDLELVSKRQASRELLEQKNQGFNPLCGDVVIFPGGDRLRISYVWDREGQPNGIQTSHGGRWYWADTGEMDFSGSLLVSIPADTLTYAESHTDVAAWIFHHDLASAHRGVDVVAHVRVWRTTADLPTS